MKFYVYISGSDATEERMRPIGYARVRGGEMHDQWCKEVATEIEAAELMQAWARSGRNVSVCIAIDRTGPDTDLILS